MLLKQASIGVSDHGNLSGLADNDHTQYVNAVAALPLTLAGQSITFNYDSNDFQLSGNDLQVKDSGIDHDSLTNTHNLTTDIDHDTITNNHNLTTDIDHDALTNFAANEHIDWTNASSNFKTSGTCQSSKFYPASASWRLELYGDSTLALGAGMEMYSKNAGFNQGNFNFIANYGAGAATGKVLFLSTPDGASFATTLSVLNDGKVGIGHGSPDRALHIEVLTGGLTTTDHLFRLSKYPGGTPSAGFGIGIEYELKNAGGGFDIASTLETIWTDSNVGSQDSDFIIKLVDGGASAAERFRITSDGDLTLYDGGDIVLGTSTGSKIGTATSQKLGFYNVTPIIQPSSTGETSGFTAGSGTGVNDDSTFTGNVGATAYRISDIVKHLKNLGLIAQ